MKHLRKIIILILILQVPLAWAYIQKKDTCTSIDVRDLNPNIANNPSLRDHFSVPRNQRSYGWCYAFTAADMMTAEIGTPVSAIHTGAIYTPKRNEEVFKGGWADEAILEVQSNGWVCTEEGLPYGQSDYKQIDELIKDLEEIKSRSLVLHYGHEEVCKEVWDVVRPFNVVEGDVDEMAKSLLKDQLNVTVNIFASSACSEKVTNLPRMEIKKFLRPKLEHVEEVWLFISKMNWTLERGKVIAVNYYLDRIIGKDQFHTSLITGRRWNKNRCEYKIRNTWGASCEKYLPSIDCDAEEGSFWIPEELFLDMTRSIQYIESPTPDRAAQVTPR